MKQPKLLDVPATAPTKAARVKAFKEQHGIWTHYAGKSWGRENDPWQALLVNHAREAMAGYGASAATEPMDLIARFCRLLDERNLLVTGTSERDAIRRLCAENDILFPL